MPNMHFIYKLVTQILIFSFVVMSFNGLSTDEGVFSLVLGGVIFGVLMYLVNPVLDFFNFPRNFWGYLIIGTIFSLGYFVVLNTFIVGILDFSTGSVGGSFGPVEFPAMSLETEFISVIFAALYASALSIILEFLSDYR